MNFEEFNKSTNDSDEVSTCVVCRQESGVTPNGVWTCKICGITFCNEHAYRCTKCGLRSFCKEHHPTSCEQMCNYPYYENELNDFCNREIVLKITKSKARKNFEIIDETNPAFLCIDHIIELVKRKLPYDLNRFVLQKWEERSDDTFNTKCDACDKTSYFEFQFMTEKPSETRNLCLIHFIDQIVTFFDKNYKIKLNVYSNDYRNNWSSILKKFKSELKSLINTIPDNITVHHSSTDQLEILLEIYSILSCNNETKNFHFLERNQIEDEIHNRKDFYENRLDWKEKRNLIQETITKEKESNTLLAQRLKHHRETNKEKIEKLIERIKLMRSFPYPYPTSVFSIDPPIDIYHQTVEIVFRKMNDDGAIIAVFPYLKHKQIGWTPKERYPDREKIPSCRYGKPVNLSYREIIEKHSQPATEEEYRLFKRHLISYYNVSVKVITWEDIDWERQKEILQVSE